MRITWLLVFLIISPNCVLAETVDVEFQSSNNSKYRTTSLTADLKRHYGFDFNGGKVLLIEIPYLSSPHYETQSDQLSQLGHKEYPVVFVVACQNEELKYGYHTTTEEARKLANGMIVFRVRLLDSKGVVMNESAHPVLVGELIEWFEK